MSVELRWSEEAEQDLQSLFAYINAENPRAAESYTETIAAACERLCDFPASGRVYSNRYRVLVVRNHLVFYEYDEAGGFVRLAAIIDGRRDISAILDDEQSD